MIEKKAIGESRLEPEDVSEKGMKKRRRGGEGKTAHRVLQRSGHRGKKHNLIVEGALQKKKGAGRSKKNLLHRAEAWEKALALESMATNQKTQSRKKALKAGVGITQEIVENVEPLQTPTTKWLS